MPHAITTLLTESEAITLEARLRDMLDDMGCSLRKDPDFSGTDPRDAKFMIFDSDGDMPMASHGGPRGDALLDESGRRCGIYRWIAFAGVTTGEVRRNQPDEGRQLRERLEVAINAGDQGQIALVQSQAARLRPAEREAAVTAVLRVASSR